MKLKENTITGAIVILIGLLALGIAPLTFAETRVSGEELQKLLSGNTGEGKFIKWETTHKTYFEATGKFRRLDSLNNKQKGEWYINKSGELCMVGKHKENCNVVMKRDDGGYNLYVSNNLHWTLDTIVPGNPNNL